MHVDIWPHTKHRWLQMAAGFRVTFWKEIQRREVGNHRMVDKGGIIGCRGIKDDRECGFAWRGDRSSLKLESPWAHRHLYARHTGPRAGTLSVLFTLLCFFYSRLILAVTQAWSAGFRAWLPAWGVLVELQQYLGPASPMWNPPPPNKMINDCIEMDTRNWTLRQQCHTPLSAGHPGHSNTRTDCWRDERVGLCRIHAATFNPIVTKLQASGCKISYMS